MPLELYETSTQLEQLITAKADRQKVPIGGSIELLPLCNMNCKMCYIRMSRAEMEQQGRLRRVDEWLEIARQAREAGTLFLLLTGGEPFLYPGFKTLYEALSDMGFVITINTNGTMIDADWADFLAQKPCRRLNITLYGTDNETYDRLCGNPQGFDQVKRAAELLKAREVPFRFNCSVTPQNAALLPELFGIAKRFDAALSAASYMFPSMRKGGDGPVYGDRLSPEEAAAAMLACYRLEHPEADYSLAKKQTLSRLQQPPRLQQCSEGFPCHAGHSGFWINWKAEMTPCAMFDRPAFSLDHYSFADAWKQIVAECGRIRLCGDCLQCEHQSLCGVCPAYNYCETGRIDGKPDYVCRMVEEEIRLLKA